MRYQTENKYRKYVPGYGFLSFARKFGDKYGKKLMNTEINYAKKFSNSKYGKKIIDTTKKEGTNFAKITGKSIVQRSAEGTGDLIGNKIADKISSLGKSKNKEKESEINEPEEIIIRLEKRQQIINDLRLL